VVEEVSSSRFLSLSLSLWVCANLERGLTLTSESERSRWPESLGGSPLLSEESDPFGAGPVGVWFPTVARRSMPSLGPARPLAVGIRVSPAEDEMSRVAGGKPVVFFDLPNRKDMVVIP
jgi:hypothetical protein